MRRAIRISLVAVSALLGVAMLASWAVSLRVAYIVGYLSPTSIDGRYARDEWLVKLDGGLVRVGKITRIPIDDASASRLREFDQGPSGSGLSYEPYGNSPVTWERLVHSFVRPRWGSGVHPSGQETLRYRYLTVPHWLLLLVTTLPALIALVRFVRSRRAARRAGFAVQPLANAPSGSATNAATSVGQETP